VSGVIENEKVTNDAAASIRALATRWHRNADWAERAVRDAISASADEAARLGVVDLVAPTPSALLSAVGGCSQAERTFTTGELSTTGPLPGVCPNAAIQPFGMSLSESGAAVLILGGLLLFNPTVPSARVSIPLILAVAAGFVLFSIFVLGALVEAKRAPVATGMEWLRGAEGIALSAIDPAGRVRAGEVTWE